MKPEKSRVSALKILSDPKIYGVDRYEFAMNALLQTAASGSRVFDIGAGDGPMKSRLELAGYEWVGFDLFPRHSWIQKWNLDDPCPVREANRDAVLLLEVIEHLGNAATALLNIRASLRSGGILVLTTPNPRWSKSRLMALATGYLSCFTIHDLEANGHVYPVWPHILLKLLDDAGFAVSEFGLLEGPTRHWPRPAFHPSWLMKIAGNLVCRLIEKQDRTACGMSYGMIATAT